MKKLFLLAGAVLFMASCGGNSGNKVSDSTSVQTAKDSSAIMTDSLIDDKSLNNLSEKETKDQADNFVNTMATFNPGEGYFLISRDLLIKIVDVLEAEYKNQPDDKKPQTDGLRIYFGRETKNSPLSLMLVATTNVISPVADKTHNDYYTYTTSAAARLFSKKTNFTMQFFPDHSAGAVLFKKCQNNCAENADCDGQTSYPNYITRSEAETMVMNYKGEPLVTKAVWFGFPVLKAMTIDPRFIAMRVYLAKHTATDVVPKYRNKHTVILTTTQLVGETVTDYFDCQELLKNVDYVNKLMKPMTPPINNGELCPNNCN